MDDELKDRFKAMFSIGDAVKKYDEEEQKGIRELEVEFEEKYKEIYASREGLISGTTPLDDGAIAAFDKRAEEMKDDDYWKVMVAPCDVKSLQDTTKGVSDFWIRSMVNH